MRIFMRVAELKSFSGCAIDLALPKSSVSHAIQQLENTMQCRLLTRTTRKVSLTHEGEVFYQRCKDILADVDELTTLFQQDNEPLAGRIRVDMPQAMCRRMIMPKLAEFLALHPELEIELSCSDRRVNLIEEGFDCVVRVGSLSDSSLIAKKVTEYKMVNCVSTRYLENRGNIESLACLKNHTLIRYSQTLGEVDPGFEYQDQHGQIQCQPMSAQITVNNTDAYKEACLAGLGLIQVPEHAVKDEIGQGILVAVLAQYQLPAMPVNILYANRRHLPKRTRVFIDWLAAQLNAAISSKRNQQS